MKLGAVALITCFLAACSADSPELDRRLDTDSLAPQESPASHETRVDPVSIACGDAIGIEPPLTDDRFTIVDDAVALPSASRPALQAIPLEEGGTASPDDPLSDGKWLWAKQGVAVRSGRTLHLSVAPDAADDIRIGWGHAPITPATSAMVNCSSDDLPASSAAWLAFPGGYWVREAGCYTIYARVDNGQPQPVDIGIGAPCPGQEPPIEL